MYGRGLRSFQIIPLILPPRKITRRPRRVRKYCRRWGFQDPSPLRSARASTGLRAEEALQLKAGMSVGDEMAFFIAGEASQSVGEVYAIIVALVDMLG